MLNHRKTSIMGLCVAIIIGILTSETLAQTEWQKYPNNPVLNLGPGSAWDHDMVSASAVILDGATYKMWYTGGDGSKCRIGYATSTDGITWSKYSGNPVLTETGSPGWEYWHVATPSVIFDGSEYKMWYHGCSDDARHSIGYATSPDGIVWSKYPANPVLVSGAAGKWDEKYVNCPTALFDGTEYRMWYTACNNSIHFKIGYATSSDGITWIKYPNPVLDVGSTGAWDSVGTRTAVVIFISGEYKMWYGGYDGSNYRIGYATSPDGINWTKYDDPNTTLPPFAESDPVLDIGPDGSWEGVEVYLPSVLFDGTEYKMWYTGADGSQAWIGYAATPMDIIPVKIDIKPGSFPNAINLGSRGVIPVAILTTSIADGDPIDFDVTEVDQSSLTFAKAAARVRGKSGKIGSLEDVDGDTDLDLVVHFPTSELELTEQDTEAVLEGQTIDGIPIQGSDTIMVVPRAAAAKFPEFALHQNFPNFFNPDTWIPYQLAEDVKVTITIYDASGKLIRTLDLGHKTPGFYMTKDKAAYWDGKNEIGEQVASGVYFYTIQAGEFTATKKMVIVE